MANDFTNSCKALWRFESGALTTDSIGTNTLTASTNAPTADTTNYREGSASALYTAANLNYHYITDANLNAGFPFKSGDSVKKATFCLWHIPVTLPAAGVYRFIISKWLTGQLCFGLLQYGTALRLGWATAGSTAVYWDIATLTAGRVYHIGLVIDGVAKTARCRVYDVTAGTATTYSNSFGNVLNVGTANFVIGAAQGSPYVLPINGNVDELVAFNYHLSDLEIDWVRQGLFYPRAIIGQAGLQIVYTPAQDITGAGGIASAEAFGTQIVSPGIYGAGGIVSAEAFGTAEIATTFAGILPDGIESAEEFGAPQLNLNIKPSSIDSAEEFGEPGLSQNILPTGIASGEVFGEPRLKLFILPESIASEESIGEPEVAGYNIIIPSSIPSGESIGAPTILPGAVTISPAGIPSQEIFGSASVKSVIKPSSIPSQEALGIPRLNLVIKPQGIASQEAFGNPRLKESLIPVGIGSVEAFGTANVSLVAYENPGDGTDEVIPGGRNWRVIVPSSQIKANGNRIQITIQGASGRGATASVLGGCAIAERDDTTDDYLTTPTRITFNGGDHGITVNPRATVVSDWVAFNISRTKTYLVHLYWSGSQTLANWPGSGTYEDGRLDPPNESLIKVVNYNLVSNKAYALKKIATQTAIVNITPTGIPSAEAFGTARISENLLPAGITSEEALGTPNIVKVVKPVGIPSLEVVGTPLIEPQPVSNYVLPIGIESEEAFGTPAIDYEQDIIPVGIDSLEAVGEPIVEAGAVNIVVDLGIESAEAFGIPALQFNQDIEPVGIESGEAIGEPLVETGSISIVGIGIGSEEYFGTPQVISDQTIQPVSIDSEEVFGSPVVVPPFVQTMIRGIGIPSEEVFGTPGLVYNQIIEPVGIASEEVFGKPLTETIGPAAKTFVPEGIQSEEVFGNPTLIYDQDLTPVGIESREVFGRATLSTGAIDILPEGIPSAEVVGTPSLPKTQYIYPEGIPPGYGFGLAESMFVFHEYTELEDNALVTLELETGVPELALHDSPIETLELEDGAGEVTLYDSPIRMVSNG